MHPFVKILLLIYVLLLMGGLSARYLWPLCILVCLYALIIVPAKFLHTVKRMKWLFLSILLIYAYGTPGEYVPYFSVNLAPTFEGSKLGMLQIAKLLIALAVLNCLFATSSKAQLMSGLQLLLSPLHWLGFKPQCFIARLLLTLDYVETLVAKETFKFNFNQLESMLSTIEISQGDQTIILQHAPLRWFDQLLIAALMIATLVLLYYRVIL